MSQKAVFWIVMGMALLLAVVSVVMFIVGIWTDSRWIDTGLILLFCGIFVGIGAAAIK